MKIQELVIDSDERAGEGGFLALRRLRLRNRRSDGTLSPQYLCDHVVRPYGQDAVVVVVWSRLPTADYRLPAEVRVLVRDGLRPAIAMSRQPDKAPLPEPAPTMMLTELVAGIVEEGDHGEAGLKLRAAHEVAEEAGFDVDPKDVVLLGAGMYPSPGSMVEKFYFAAVEVDPATQKPLEGDGSPMEEGARTRWLSLPDALAACMRGDISDLKTELGLRRLADHLWPQSAVGSRQSD